MAAKLDFNKAYDRVQWDFFKAVLRKMGFHDIWVNWVMQCITTVTFAVVVNGVVRTTFIPSRGIRQGEPLSPYLFLLVIEVLSKLLQKSLAAGKFSGIKISRGCPVLSHLFFADDALLFFKANVAHCIRWAAWDKLTMPKLQGGMGFRDFRSFNRALLAHQGWRLSQFPNSFCAQIFKGRYYPQSNFWTARKGPWASWAWTSLLVGREVLKRGVRWQVFNGKSINFWNDKWVTFSPNFCVKSQKPLGCQLTKVSEAINHNTNYWNVNVLQSVISKDKVDKICLIPIVTEPQDDRLIWHHDPKGLYSVKSEYRVAVTESVHQSETRPSSSFQMPEQVWKFLWALPIPQKLRNFWCAGNWLAWHIWKCRNDMVFNQQPIDPLSVIFRAAKDSCEYASALRASYSTPSRLNSHRTSDRVWIPPRQGSFKANCDVALRPGTSRASMAVIFRNSSGSVMEGAARFEDVGSILQGEALAIRWV
ncbi:uncharacterized protein LOC114311986 [Camellia sinensis]|uniref:uncharacterized protein LOC114311986 n=1 Tax=Camellia sinensis TaxID=4442 RepID=UPI001036E2BD|nr:uncharacterized protein LOC114311986 [Camellia sinensis]